MTDNTQYPQQPPSYPPQQQGYPPQQPQPGYTQPVYPPAGTPAPGSFSSPPGGGGQRNILGIIALIVAGLGFVFACIPGALIIGWILLPIGFILGLVAVFLRDKKKWQAITAIIVAIVGTIVGFIVFFAVVAVSFNDAFNDGGTSIGSESSTVEESEAPAEEATAAEGTLENPVPFGTPISNDDWDVTLTAFTPDANSAVAEGNQFNQAPEAGQVYVIVEVSATYKGTGEGTTSLVQVDYVDDATVVSSWDSLVVGVEPRFGQASLLNGGTDAGKLVFLVPAPADGLIRVQPGTFNGDEVYFSLP